MTETIHALIEQYGLVAVFAGCIFEGETAAILAGFFAHQGVFVTWQAVAAVFLGAFTGDVLAFLAGRHFAEHALVQWLREKPGFNRAYALLRSHPDLFVLANRFIYGMRAAGGVVAGLSGIAMWRFLVLNAISATAWTALFSGLGFVFGLGAETILGETLQKHHRLLLAVGIGLAMLLLGHWLARRFIRAGRARRDAVETDSG
jgi:membrane protein DedA with SNARE-associated domain